MAKTDCSADLKAAISCRSPKSPLRHGHTHIIDIESPERGSIKVIGLETKLDLDDFAEGLLGKNFADRLPPAGKSGTPSGLMTFGVKR